MKIITTMLLAILICSTCHKRINDKEKYYCNCNYYNIPPEIYHTYIDNATCHDCYQSLFYILKDFYRSYIYKQTVEQK